MKLLPLDPFADTPQAAENASHASVAKLLEFFRNKGLAKLKEEDRAETWYDDWVEYNRQHGLYAMLLSPKAYSNRGSHFDLFKLVRFVENFGACNASHGYSLQVSFLGIFPILMSDNDELKRRAVEALEAGGLFAFGVSEKEHGSDLYSNSFSVIPAGDGRYVARGKKYYIGNSNVAAMISVLGQTPGTGGSKDRFVFFALPATQASHTRKIRTLGVRQAFVGEFEVEDKEFGAQDVIARGSKAWDAVFGTVNLGKFLLGYGSVGMCERAFGEAMRHMRGRKLFGTAVADMPHIRASLVQAFARLAAMKLYAYRAVDYLQVSSESDRRYLLFNSVQKAGVSTEGVRVMQILMECVGAKGFEADTYFETALRDSILIPGLEGSTHINFGLTAKLMKGFLFEHDRSLVPPPSLWARGHAAENPNIFRTTAGSLKNVKFGDYRPALREAAKLARNVGVFSSQVQAFRAFVMALSVFPKAMRDAELIMALGKTFAVIAYGQLVAENAVLNQSDASLVEVIFQYLVEDLSVQALKLRGVAAMPTVPGLLLSRVMQSTKTAPKHFDAVEKILRESLG